MLEQKAAKPFVRNEVPKWQEVTAENGTPLLKANHVIISVFFYFCWFFHLCKLLLYCGIIWSNRIANLVQYI